MAISNSLDRRSLELVHGRTEEEGEEERVSYCCDRLGRRGKTLSSLSTSQSKRRTCVSEHCTLMTACYTTTTLDVSG